MAQGISPKLPLTTDENDGFCTLTKDYREMVKQNMKMLILTCPGERIMDLNYGVGLRNYLFMENVPSVLNDISTKIYEQVAYYMPFVEIEDLPIQIIGEEENILSIKIFYNIIPLGSDDMLSIDQKIE